MVGRGEEGERVTECAITSWLCLEVCVVKAWPGSRCGAGLMAPCGPPSSTSHRVMGLCQSAPGQQGCGVAGFCQPPEAMG